MIYILEGNIGAGKSTFLSLIQSTFPSITIVQEPVNKWLQVSQGDSLLEKFYEDSRRWAFSLETYTMITRMLELKKLHESPETIIMERSLYSGHYCFAKNGFDQGFFHSVEWSIYEAWANFFLPQLPNPQGFIYLQSSPDICFERIIKRNRSAEKTISLEYLKQIHEKHESFLIKKEGLSQSLTNIPVLTLSVNEDFESNTTIQNIFTERINNFLTNSSLTQ